MGHNGCDGSQASLPWAIGSGYRFTTFAGAVPHVTFLVFLLLGFIQINGLLKLMWSMVIPFYWAGFWPIVVAGRR